MITQPSCKLIILSIVVVIYSFLIILFDYPYQISVLNSMFALGLSCYLVVKVRKRSDLLIAMFCILYENYSIVVGCYLDPSLRPEFLYNQFTDMRSYGVASLSLLWFEYTMLSLFFIYKKKIISYRVSIDEFPYNKYIVWICFLCYTLLFVSQTNFTFDRRGGSNSIEEYKFIFLIIGSLFSLRNKYYKRMWTLLVMVSSLLVFLGGNRVSTIGNLLILALLWYEQAITIKSIVMVSLPCIFLMIMVGAIRNNPDLSVLSFSSFWDVFVDNKLVADTFTFAFVPTIAVEQLSFILDGSTKIDLLINNLIYVFIGGSYGEYILPNFSRDYYVHYYGFLGANYFDMWLRGFGGIVVGITVVWFLFLCGSLKTKHTAIYRVMSLGAFANIMRWYNYNFMQFYRTMLLVAIVWMLFSIINRLTVKADKNYKIDY